MIDPSFVVFADFPEQLRLSQSSEMADDIREVWCCLFAGQSRRGEYHPRLPVALLSITARVAHLIALSLTT